MPVSAGVRVYQGKVKRGDASAATMPPARASGGGARRQAPSKIDMGATITHAWNPSDASENEQLFRVCVDAIMEGLVLQDACGNIRFCNRSAEQILGATAEQLRAGIGPSPFQSSVDEDGNGLSGARSPFNQALQTGKPVEGVVMGIRRPDGELRWIQVNAQPVFDKGRSEPAATVATFVDITSRKDAERQMNDQLEQIRCLNAMMKLQMRELENANAQLEALAAHDGLTGLKNHRAFHERLNSEVARAIRYHTPLSVILIDVDHFKLYNDTFGHPAGDTVLRQLAQILNENARTGDVVARPRSGRGRGECTIARHGGEEFAVILPNADASAAMKVAERLRASIQKAEWPHRPVTASFGVVTLSPVIADPTALIAAADKALYRSKTRGRNRVTCAPGSRVSSAVAN